MPSGDGNLPYDIGDAVSPLTSSKKKMNTSSSRKNDFRKMGLKVTPRKSAMLSSGKKDCNLLMARSAADSLKLESDDPVGQFGEESLFCYTDKECTWLSSGSSSPSSFFNDRPLGSDLLLDKWLSSWLSRPCLNTVVDLCGGAIDIDKCHADDLNDEAAENWLIASSDSSRSSCGLSHDETVSFEHSWSESSGKNILDSTSFPSAHADIISSLVSLMSLDSADSEYICGAEFDLEDSQSDCLSPSFQRQIKSTVSKSTSSTLLEPRLRNSKCDLSSEEFAEIVDIESPNNEPIFWPFARKFDWDTTETMQFLSMSPRKQLSDSGISKSTVLNFLGGKVEGSMKSIQQYTSRSKNSKGSELNPRSGMTHCRRRVSTTGPSKLSGMASRSSAKIVPSQTGD